MNNINKLSELYTLGKIDRRTFMQGVIGLGVTISAASTLAVQAEAGVPRSGGFMRVGHGHGSTTDSLDPGTYENGFTTGVSFGTSNHLTEVGQDGQLIPELAESFEATADAATWRFKLRPGITFSNGKSMTTEDVIDSFNFHRGDDSKSAAKGLLTSVTSIKADGDTVVFTLDSGNADFPFIVSDYHLKIMPSDGNGNALWADGIGTGGYILQNWEPGVRAEYTRNPDYWKEGAAHFDEILQLSIIDKTARQSALMNGEVDAIDRVDAKTVNLMAKVPTINIVEVTGTLHYTMPMRVDATPFDNYDLRMAMKLSVKRQELVDKILLGHGAVGNDHPISTANRYHNGDLAQREFDADKAAFHYKKSGHSGTLQLSSSDAAFSGAVDASQLVKASAAEAGIDIEVIREPTDGYWSNVWNKKSWSMSYWGGRPTEDWMFSAAYVKDTEWNATAWRTGAAADRFNELVVSARKELDDSKRRAMYYEAQALLNDDGGLIVPMFANYIMGIGKQVGHAEKMAANWDMDGSKWMERWWMKS
jgi:peptide/nickel transport system substrate-binding protein